MTRWSITNLMLVRKEENKKMDVYKKATLRTDLLCMLCRSIPYNMTTHKQIIVSAAAKLMVIIFWLGKSPLDLNNRTKPIACIIATTVYPDMIIV